MKKYFKLVLFLFLCFNGLSQPGSLPSHFKLSTKCPIYFQKSVESTDNLYNLIQSKLKDRGFRFVDSSTMLNLYMEEISTRRNRLRPDEQIDQNKQLQIMFGGRTAVQILKISFNFFELTTDSLAGLSVSITQLPTLKNKSYREVQFIPKSSFPISVQDGIEELLDVISAKKE